MSAASPQHGGGAEAAEVTVRGEDVHAGSGRLQLGDPPER
jgi:hypothetical protein